MVVVDVVVVDVDVVEGAGNVPISAPVLVLSSVREPVAAAGVALLAPDRLATHRSSPETAKADSSEK